MNIYEQLLQKVTEIENEMKRIKFWSDTMIQIDPKDCTEAFCADKLAFQQWLQFVFIPNVRKIISEKEELPADSEVGLRALNEFDGMSVDPEAKELVAILQSFDQLIVDHK
jgi:uncharacterized protein YqcC (DUF446 family)